ncbi:nuclear transport factor 2 family protein [Oceanobacillus sp. 1P07AA]|uniref:nuclear transport factor 2 family protein n=1 Tax=Oceanobacillus sp. 1P07AA TaxID=3132293 RepID=UPI0039A72766
MSIDLVLVEKINKAFSVGDVDFLYEHITDDVVMNQIGDSSLKGREAFINNMEPMRGFVADKYEVNRIFTDKDSAIVEGEMHFSDENGNKKAYGFCDIYTFTGSKISNLTAFMIPINN